MRSPFKAFGVLHALTSLLSLAACSAPGLPERSPLGAWFLFSSIVDRLSQESASEAELWPTIESDIQGSITALVNDGTYLYIGGYLNSDTSLDWRIEKRRLSTGALVSEFGTRGVVVSEPTTGDDELLAIGQIDGFVYACGFQNDNANGGSQVRIEKRNATTGELETAFGTGGVFTGNLITGGVDICRGLAVDATDLIVAGVEARDGTMGGPYMAMSRLDPATGIGTSNPFGFAGAMTQPGTIYDVVLPPVAISARVPTQAVVAPSKIPPKKTEVPSPGRTTS